MRERKEGLGHVELVGRPPPLLIYIDFGKPPPCQKFEVLLPFMLYILLLRSLRAPIGIELSLLTASIRTTRDSLEPDYN